MPEGLRRAARVRGALLTAVCVALLPTIAVGLTYSPLFGAREIDVEGNRELSAADVMSLADVAPGTNVVHLDTDGVAARLQQSPWIESASVTTDLPSTIAIRVQERAPVAVVERGDVVGPEGVVLPGATATGLPVLRVAHGADVAGATAVLDAMAPVLRARVAAVEVAADGRIVVRLHADVPAVFGPPGDEAAKATALRSVIGWANDQSVRLASVDVTVPSAPAATLADGSTVTP
jgi:cell division protein FtsQ